MMMHLLVFTPTYADKLQPATVRSVVGQQFGGRLTWEIGRYNPHPEPGNANVLAQYQRARDLFLAGDYDAMLTVEHDMVVPPEAAQKLYSTAAPVVYGVYMLRHGSHVLNAWQLCGRRSLGMSLSIYPKELAAHQKAGVGEVSGVGFGCTLIRREVIERFPFRSEDDSAPDVPFAKDCLRAGVLQLARFDVACGHIDADRGGAILNVNAHGEGGQGVRVQSNADVTIGVNGRTMRLYPGKRYTLPQSQAEELQRAGYVRIVGDDTTSPTEARETATAPKTTKRERRG